MNKTSRKRSQDPLQEHLRQSKDDWNKDVKKFIDDLINTKKTMNGYPSKLVTQRSFIKNPIPISGSVLSSLLSDFNEIVQKGNSIVKEQIEYSEKRKKQIESKASFDDELESLASNPLSRFVSRFKFEDKRTSLFRKDFLKSCIDMYNHLRDLEVMIVSFDKDSIVMSEKIFDKVYNKFIYLNKNLATFKKSDSKDNTNEVIETAKKGALDVKEFVSKLIDKKIVDKDNEILKNLVELANKPIDELFIANSFKEKYLSALDYFSKKERLPLTSFKNLLDAKESLDLAKKEKEDLAKKEKEDLAKKTIPLKKEKKAPTQQIANDNSTTEETLQGFDRAASSSIARLVAKIKKMKHESVFGNNTSALRVDIYNSIIECKKIVDKMMDVLEDSINYDLIASANKLLGEYLISIRDSIKSLLILTKGQTYNNTFVDLLNKGLLSEDKVDLSEEDKAKLLKRLEDKKLRNLSNWYSK